MKRTLCLFLVILFMLSGLTVSAADNPIFLKCDGCDIYIKTADVFAALEGSIEYDTELLDFAGIDFPQNLKSLNKSNDSIRIRGGRVDFIILSETSGHSGEWAKLSFLPRTSLPASCAFTVTEEGFAVTLGAERRRSSEVVFQSYINQQEGDVNLDRKVDIRDIIRTKKYFAGSVAEQIFSEINADFDADGYITSRDFVLLRKLLLGAV